MIVAADDFPYLQEPAPICRICREDVVMLREFVICAAMARRIFSRAAAIWKVLSVGQLDVALLARPSRLPRVGRREARFARPGPDYGVSD